MKVAVSVHGRFHAFELATHLHREGMLAQVATAYPAFVARRYLPAGVKLATRPGLEAIRRLHRALGIGPSPDFFIARAFGRFSARHLPAADILVGWSGASLEAVVEAKRRGMRIALERGSTHIVAQTEILREAHARWGISWNATDPRLIERELAEYAAADIIVTGSAYARESFLAHGVAPERVVVNPYGVDLSRFRPRPAAAPRAGKRRVLFVGEVGVRKGVPWLLEAFARLPQEWELHLVGPLAPGFRAVLARLPIDRVVLRGALSRAALAVAYREADIFCLPSLEEGFSLVILQAMASGLPVVTTPAAGWPDATSDGREIVLVPPCDSASLADALGRLAGDEAFRRALGVAAAARVASGFTWDDYGRRAVATLRALI